jgi:hypothetical protein
MLKRRKLLLAVCVAALYLSAAPAMADMFGFSFGNLSSTFDGTSSFSTSDWTETTGDLYRNVPPAGTASFDDGSWGMGSEALSIQMTISNITATTADGAGTLTLTDVDGDNVSANVKGDWKKVCSFATFTGTLSSVYYNQITDTTFDGHSGDAVSMVFTKPEPWSGAIVQLTSSDGWFDQSYTDLKGGSIDALVVPVPAAVLLGMLGLGAVGLGMRRFA